MLRTAVNNIQPMAKSVKQGVKYLWQICRGESRELSISNRRIRNQEIQPCGFFVAITTDLQKDTARPLNIQ